VIPYYHSTLFTLSPYHRPMLLPSLFLTHSLYISPHEKPRKIHNRDSRIFRVALRFLFIYPTKRRTTLRACVCALHIGNRQPGNDYFRITIIQRQFKAKKPNIILAFHSRNTWFPLYGKLLNRSAASRRQTRDWQARVQRVGSSSAAIPREDRLRADRLRGARVSPISECGKRKFAVETRC